MQGRFPLQQRRHRARRHRRHRQFAVDHQDADTEQDQGRDLRGEPHLLARSLRRRHVGNHQERGHPAQRGAENPGSSQRHQ